LHIELPPNDVLRERLDRDKVPFGKAKESIEESFRQNMAYKSVLQDMVATPNILACHIPYVDGITVDQTADVIIGIVGQ
ncbi:hypothetical protein, partial [Streptomyces brasiliscabiei]|uniref:hypothetical protein n=1 Tax=Streptomyces brasiliscabiei TaxID=2736302 RepID=UPI001C0F45C0